MVLIKIREKSEDHPELIKKRLKKLDDENFLTNCQKVILQKKDKLARP